MSSCLPSLLLAALLSRPRQHSPPGSKEPPELRGFCAIFKVVFHGNFFLILLKRLSAASHLPEIFLLFFHEINQ